MSCWCDGDDPGCETCHPKMVPETRADLRALQLAQLNLLDNVARDVRTSEDVLRAADTYREAVKRANTWNTFGTGRKDHP